MKLSLDKMTRIAGTCLEVGLGIFLLVVFFVALDSPDGKAAAKSRVTKSQPAAASAAGVAQLGTICLQDESNGNFLTFDDTGAYTFTNCTDFTLTGVGVVKIKGLVVTLSDVKPDRRVSAFVDLALRQGKAAAQTFAPARTLTIRDKNIDNNTCTCAITCDGKTLD
jgi:hypothetical protein